MSEPPIYVQDIVYSEHFDTSSANAVTSRNPISGSSVWIDIDQVPAAPPEPAPWPGGVPSGVARGISGVPLGQVPGMPRRFAYRYADPPPTPPYDHFKDIIPANYSDNTYVPLLVDAEGREVQVNPGHVIFDGYLMVVEFKETPDSLGYAPPFTLTYWQYTGRFAVGDTAPSITPDVSAGLGGISVVDAGGSVQIGNTLTGLNLLPAVPPLDPPANIFAQKSASFLEFRSLVAGMNVTITEESGSITISAAPGGTGFSGAANLGSDPNGEIHVPDPGSTLRLRGLLAGPGLSLAMSATDIQINPDVATVANNAVGGARVFAGMTGAVAYFRCIAGVNGVDVYEDGGQVKVDFPLDGGAGISVAVDALGSHVSSTVTASSVGAGTDVFFERNATTGDLVFNRLAHGTGISVTGGSGGSIVVANTMTGANAGSGDSIPGYASVYKNTAAGVINMRALKAGGNIELGLAGDDIVVSSLAPALSVLVFQARVPTGVQGGGSLAGTWHPRALTVLDVQGGALGVSISAGKCALPAGKYFLSATSAAYRVGSHCCRVVDETASAVLATGSAEMSAADQTRSTVACTFELAAAALIRLDHYCAGARPFDGLGHAAGIPGVPEVYAQVTVYLFG